MRQEQRRDQIARPVGRIFDLAMLGELRRTAGWTAVPVAAEMIERLAPLLGLRPTIEPETLAGITLTSQ